MACGFVEVLENYREVKSRNRETCVLTVYAMVLMGWETRPCFFSCVEEPSLLSLSESVCRKSRFSHVNIYRRSRMRVALNDSATRGVYYLSREVRVSRRAAQITSSPPFLCTSQRRYISPIWLMTVLHKSQPHSRTTALYLRRHGR